MPVTYVSGDPLLTRAQALAFGHNAGGRTELGALETQLLHHFPAAFSAFRKRCRRERTHTGDLWFWRESRPYLAFMVIRDSSVGATRLRYVETAAITLARDYVFEGLRSVAIASLGDSLEWPAIMPVLERWLAKLTLPVVVYERYLPGVQADEPLNG